jgi:hypothetical protein
MLDMRERYPEPQPTEPHAAPRGARPAAAAGCAPRRRRRSHRGVEAEAELAFREQRIADREAQFNVAVQRVVYELANAIVDGTVAELPQDELARARARRGGFAA